MDMAVKDVLSQVAARLLLERPAKKQSIAAFAAQLEREGSQMADRLHKAPDTARNREQLRHIITIERWGQRRLRVALGEPPVTDESDDYAPDAALDWDALRAAFAATRAETVRLARELIHPDNEAVLVRHNELGPLTVRGWLRYLGNHAWREALVIK